MKEKIYRIFNHEADAIKNIPVTDAYGQAVELIYRHVQQQQGKVVASGMGKAGQIAHNIATTLSSTGTPAAYLHPSEAQHGDLGILQENDIMLVISNSGKTREIIELIDLKNILFPEVPVILITGNPQSPLCEKTSCHIFTGNPAEVCTLGLTPTTSTTVMTAIGDAIVVLLMEKINFTIADYAKRHHGGYLGEKSRKISSRYSNENI
ncbi:MAG: SIS domain-containing protein [Bacteroidales bacterium]|jgi:arabinose-5-phosphate isomerase|nr:SIS domain-containing protein [Bacteroidales bacterium]